MAGARHPEVLDPAFLAERRARLHEERDEVARVAEHLAADLESLVQRREAGESGVEGFGRGETASVDLERVRGEHAHARARLGGIDAALARLDAGTYGSCEDCGDPIGRDRLEAIPSAPRCVGCEGRSASRGAG